MSEALRAVISSDVEIILRLLCGMIAGIAVGWERTVKQSYAGIRTFGLVGLGTATAASIFSASTEADEASRVVQGILTGVGFLGAGVITIASKKAELEAEANNAGAPENDAAPKNESHDIADHDTKPSPGAKHSVRKKSGASQNQGGPSGLTTAAAIWVTAALGCAAGLGDFHLAIIGAGLALLLLVIDHSIERMAGRRKGV